MEMMTTTWVMMTMMTTRKSSTSTRSPKTEAEVCFSSLPSVSFYLNLTYVVCFFLFSYVIDIIVCARIKYGQRLK